MLVMLMFVACGAGTAVIGGKGATDDTATSGDSGTVGDEGGGSEGGGSEGGSSGGGSEGGGSSGGGSEGGGSGGGSGGDTGGGGDTASGGTTSGGGEGGGDTGTGNPAAGTYTGSIVIEVPDWGWECNSDVEFTINADGSFDDDVTCSYDGGSWGSYDVPVNLTGTTRDGGAMSGTVTADLGYGGTITSELTGTARHGDLELTFSGEISSGGGWSSDYDGTVTGSL